MVGRDNQLQHLVAIDLPGPRLPHDMAFTEHYAIFNDCPLFWKEELFERKLRIPAFHPDMPMRFGILPRMGQSEEIQWFEAKPTYVLHWANAFEDGDEVVLDGLTKHDLETGETEHISFGEQRFGSEAPFIPRANAQSEDDGYLISFITDMAQDRSECIIIDAQDISAGPVCTIILPHRISSGTHACWASAEQLG